MINTVMELMNRPPLSKEAIIIWWNVLNKFDINIVREALNHWVDTNDTVPKPAQIKELCKPAPEFNKALPHKKSHKHQAVMASNVAKFVRENIKKHDRDWVKHWENILMNPESHQVHNVESAKRALINLGRPWKGKPSQRN